MGRCVDTALRAGPRPPAAPDAVTIADTLAAATGTLAAAGVDSPRLDAEVLLAAACGTDRTGLYARSPSVVAREAAERFAGWIARRAAREPVAYILGRQEFWSLDFVVTPAVLVPRPETERLVELALSVVPEHPLSRTGEGRGEGDQTAAPSICDLATGSGCVAVALACELPRAAVWALDVSDAALAVAAINLRRHGVSERVRLCRSDLFAAVPGRRFDVIVTNPPYVARAALPRLQPELAFEPRLALEGGEGGLEVVDRILTAAPDHLVPGGWLLMEIGADQGAAVTHRARRSGWREVTLHNDYAGRPRVLMGRL